MYDVVVLKVLGVCRRDVFVVYLFEFFMLGLGMVLVVVLVGGVVVYLIVMFVMEGEWYFLFGIFLGIVFVVIFVMIMFGLIGIW